METSILSALIWENQNIWKKGEQVGTVLLCLVTSPRERGLTPHRRPSWSLHQESGASLLTGVRRGTWGKKKVYTIYMYYV